VEKTRMILGVFVAITVWLSSVAAAPSVDLSVLPSQIRSLVFIDLSATADAASLKLLQGQLVKASGSEEELEDGSIVVVDDAYITESILDPNAQIVKGFQPNLMTALGDLGLKFMEAEAEIAANEAVDVNIIEDIIAYMKSLEQ